uniref:Uncharacterized protein n=1 Tax=Aegilops tauschii subsp. strangulata TaxID=200361 RepID=A0A453E619_AEGTS
MNLTKSNRSPLSKMFTVTLAFLEFIHRLKQHLFLKLLTWQPENSLPSLLLVKLTKPNWTVLKHLQNQLS